jgi:hypothetical protein
MKKEYWFCKIGPVDRDDIPLFGDGPLRSVIKKRFYEMFEFHAETCSSGWGLTEEMKTRLDKISLLPLTDQTGEILKKIDDLLNNRK